MAKVYFTNMRTTGAENLPAKFKRLIETAGLKRYQLRHKYVAIKIHFGEEGNMAYLRPQYARVLVDVLRSYGAKPFLCDCNTLYVGSRKDALEHLDTAYRNGYSPFSTGCQIIIGDGLRGTDDVALPVKGGKHFQHAYLGRALVDADMVISLSHFKAHEATGIGGCIKNLGMGAGSRAGKMAMHSAGKPEVESQLCISCGRCIRECAHTALSFQASKAQIDQQKCVGCGRCIGACPVDAIAAAGDETNDILNEKIAEYTQALLQNKPQFHLMLACDISPYCDCHSENDAPILPNIGMFCSSDPLALDKAVIDACLRAQPLPGSLLETCPPGSDYFTYLHPTTNWQHALDYAAELGLGQQDYDLISI